MGLVLPHAMAIALAPFPHIAGTASSLLGFIQMSLSATASALGDVKLFTIDERELKQVLRMPIGRQLLMNVVNVLSERLEVANGRVSELSDTVDLVASK